MFYTANIMQYISAEYKIYRCETDIDNASVFETSYNFTQCAVVVRKKKAFQQRILCWKVFLYSKCPRLKNKLKQNVYIL